MTQPGTYTGADGGEYRWELSVDGKSYYHVNGAGHGENIHDWPAAKAALDALVEAEQEEWAYLGTHIRISRDGLTMERDNHDGGWEAYSVNWIQDAYRKGLEVGEANERKRINYEADKAMIADGVMYQSGWNAGREWAAREDKGLRDAARELVEAALTARYTYPSKERRVHTAARKLSEQLEG
jgi:hypothetical protein